MLADRRIDGPGRPAAFRHPAHVEKEPALRGGVRVRPESRIDVAPVEVKVDAEDALVPGEPLAARAEFFVTGDAALLKVDAIATLPIASPRRFCKRPFSTHRGK
jgi:hypothetical protein